jgi:hypothetical protein
MTLWTKFARGLVAGLVCAAAVTAAPSPSRADSIEPILTLRYEFVDSSLPPEYRRDVDLRITGVNVTAKVTSYGKTVVTLTGVLPQPVLDNAIASIKGLKNTRFKGTICPGAKQNQITATYGSTKLTRNSASCAEKQKGSVEFMRTEALMKPILDTFGDRKTVFKVGKKP